ncbi:MAG TPA: hypothetical protein PKY64_00805 [Anaerolineaceae bacterium]|nr:hypothetical protein [Anaerolineaceae bacterium]
MNNEHQTKLAGVKLPTSSIITYIIALISIGFGFYKMFAYNNGDSYPYDMVNAYVGGDAYNYIINATYAGNYFILALILVIIGSVIALMAAINAAQPAQIQVGAAASTEPVSEKFTNLPKL